MKKPESVVNQYVEFTEQIAIYANDLCPSRLAEGTGDSTHHREADPANLASTTARPPGFFKRTGVVELHDWTTDE